LVSAETGRVRFKGKVLVACGAMRQVVLYSFGQQELVARVMGVQTTDAEADKGADCVTVIYGYL